MKKIITIILLSFVCTYITSQQTVKGTFPGSADKQLKLKSFTGFETYLIDSINTNDKGEFIFKYLPTDYGMGFISSEDNKPFYIILCNEDVKLKGYSFSSPENIEVLEGPQNKLFEKYASEHPRREKALSAWMYLENLYKVDSLFAINNEPKQAIAKETQRLKEEDSLFIENLTQNKYISWYLPVRKLVSSVSAIAQHRTEEIPTAIASFREIDYSDPRLYKSGLLSNAIDSHFWLIENSGRSLDSVYIEMKTSIDNMLENLAADEKKLNQITEYLFKLLERRSLFEASEYLAVNLLNDQSCSVNNDFASHLESYRVMAIGKKAPDFIFDGEIKAPGYISTNMPEKLSDIKSQYIVLVFGASWCPQCPEELFQMARLYPKWKKQNIEVIFVSLDENKQVFKNFTEVFPFISICDYQKWESPIVKNFHVFATPTIYLLDNKKEILLRPNSLSQLDSWVDWHLVQGDK